MDTQGMFISKGEKAYTEHQIKSLRDVDLEQWLAIASLQRDLNLLAQAIGKKFVDVPGQRIVTKDKE
jgi:hypothetical protein